MLVSVRFELDKVAVGQVCHRILRLYPVNIIPPILCAYVHLHVAVTRRKKRAKRGDFPKIISLSETFGRIEPSLFSCFQMLIVLSFVVSSVETQR